MPSKYTEDVIKDILDGTGWDYIGDSIKGKKTRLILLRHRSMFNGHLCQLPLARLVKGYLPNIQSLVDPAAYFKEQIAEEGWELVSEYKGTATKIVVRNPNIFNGYHCRARPNHWKRGIRPGIESLLNPTEYIREEFKKEGWTLINDYKGGRSDLYVTNHAHFGGSICRTTWTSWFIQGRRPDMGSVVDSYEYVNALLNTFGYKLKEDWVYEGSSKYFKIIELISGKEYSTNWSAISIGKLPNTPQYKIRNAIGNYVRNRKFKKDYKISEIFPKSYWEDLDRKFPFIAHDESIDHVLPISFFGTSWEQMVLANSIENLRLMTLKENAGRKNKLKSSELDEYDLWDLYYQAENPMGYEIIEDRYDAAS